MPDMLDTARRLAHSGQWLPARQACMAALRDNPNDGRWLHLAGQVELQLGQAPIATQLLQRAVAVQGSVPAHHLDLARALAAQAQWPQALATHQKAIDLAPADGEAWHARAQTLMQLGRFGPALADLQQAARLAGLTPLLAMQMANAQWTLGRSDEALSSLDQALTLDARLVPAHLYRGLLLKERGRPEEALASLDQVLAAEPAHAVALLNRGAVLQSLGRAADARDCYRQVQQLDPRQPQPHAYLGLLDAHAGDVESARSHYRQALALDPDCDLAHDLLSRLELAAFNFEAGWQAYERRFHGRPDAWSAALQGHPAWRGTNATAGTPGTAGADGAPRLYVVCEQGLGDQILYASMLRELAAEAHIAGIGIHPKLLPLMRRSFPDLPFRDASQRPEAFDWTHHLRLGSLGRFYRRSLDQFPSPHAYLRHDAARTRELAAALPGEGPLVGLSWRSTQAEVGREKSLPLRDLMQALRALPARRFVNLQYGPVDDEIATVQRELGVTVHRAPGIDPFHDVDGLAALVMACSHVVSTSNTTAHLAGALGQQTLLLVPQGYGRLWYWSDRKGRTPWYPSITVLAQQRQGDWAQPLQQVATALHGNADD